MLLDIHRAEKSFSIFVCLLSRKVWFPVESYINDGNDDTKDNYSDNDCNDYNDDNDVRYYGGNDNNDRYSNDDKNNDDKDGDDDQTTNVQITLHIYLQWF